jgi:hypothetical protein
LKSRLTKWGYDFLDPAEPQGGKEKEKAARQALSADYLFNDSNS